MPRTCSRRSSLSPPAPAPFACDDQYSPDFGPATPRYTEARLTPLGLAALAAERHQTGPIPIGLINGDLHVGGCRPPFDPHRVVAALRSAAEDPSADLAAIVGPPAFPTGCTVEVAGSAALAAGRNTTLTVAAQITVEQQTLAVVSRQPPDSSAGRIVEDLRARKQRHHHRATRGGAQEEPIQYIADVTDFTTEHGTRIEIRLAPAADQNAVLALLHGFWAIRHTIEVALGEPLQSVIATIADDAHHDLAARLLALTTAAWPSP